MRIIYMHQYFVTPEMAGGSRSFEMARRLVAAGHEVHMVTSDQSSEPSDEAWRETEEEGIRVHWTAVPYQNTMSYNSRIRAFITFAWRAARRARSLAGDVIFATSTPLTIALPAVYAARRGHAPMVFEVRDLWPAVPIAIGAIRNPLAKRAALWLEKFAYRNATRVIALAPGMADDVVSVGYPRDKTSVIPNGCDLGLFASADEGRLRQEYQWLGARPLVVFTGTFGLVNGMEYLVRLAHEIYRLDEEVRVVAIGAGREFAQTERLADELGVLNRNLFLPGQLPKTETAEWVRNCDMTIALFTGPRVVWKDATQNKFFDSLAAGRPVANNFDGWQARIAEEAGCGVILDPTDARRGAAQLYAKLSDQAWLASARRNARELAERRFNRDDQARELERVLLDAFEEFRGSPDVIGR